MADPNQTNERGEWLCPCSGCQKSIAAERKQLIQLFEEHKKDYLMYRGASFSQITGELIWAKEDAMSYSEGMDSAIAIIKNRMPKLKNKK